MLVVRNPAALAAHAGTLIGFSAWRTIDQAIIDRFAAATDDHQWIHVDMARAAREVPGGRTIAHGYLLLSLVPSLFAEVLRVETFGRSLNYGLNKVRFTAPVSSGARVRLALTLNAAEPVGGGFRYTWVNSLELENSDKPAMVAETLTILLD